MPRLSFAEQFAAAERSVDGCLIWQGYISKTGYARFSGQGAYRVAYLEFVGPIPDGMTVDHLCFTPACVEPTHLRLLTAVENVRNKRYVGRVVPADECVHGHPYTPENTRALPGGRRECRPCGRRRTAEYAKRKKAAS